MRVGLGRQTPLELSWGVVGLIQWNTDDGRCLLGKPSESQLCSCCCIQLRRIYGWAVVILVRLLALYVLACDSERIGHSGRSPCNSTRKFTTCYHLLLMLLVITWVIFLTPLLAIYIFTLWEVHWNGKFRVRGYTLTSRESLWDLAANPVLCQTPYNFHQRSLAWQLFQLANLNSLNLLKLCLFTRSVYLFLFVCELWILLKVFV